MLTCHFADSPLGPAVAKWLPFEQPGLQALLMKMTSNRARTRRLGWTASRENQSLFQDGSCRMGEVYMRQFGWSVGNPTYMEKSCSCARPISGLV
jgi:hypothetical protein